MFRKRWRTCLSWGVGCALLIGIGFALHATLPPEPRVVLRGLPAHGCLSPDGKTLIGMAQAEPNGPASLKTWDTFTGQERGEYFGGLVGGNPGDFELNSSADRRFCALIHPRGLAIADLHTSKEWPSAITWVETPCRLLPLHAALQQLIECAGIKGKVKLKTALEYISSQLEGKPRFVVDKRAFRSAREDDKYDLLEAEVELKPSSGQWRAQIILRHLLEQIPWKDAVHVARPDFIEITTARRFFAPAVSTPMFSPRGSFVAVMEYRPKDSMLHVVECATGQLLASLNARPYGDGFFGGFTSDEELYFFPGAAAEPLLTVWNPQTKQVVRTIPEIDLANDDFDFVLASGGSTLAYRTNEPAGSGVDLFDLRTGAKRQICRVAFPREIPEGEHLPHGFTFSPDCRTLLFETTDKETQVWDVGTDKKRGSFKYDGPMRRSGFSADSQVFTITNDTTFTVWNVETCERLWHRDFTEEPDGFSKNYPQFAADGRVLYERAMGRVDILDYLTGKPRARVSPAADANPRIVSFTPDGRSMVTYWALAERELWLVEEWLGKWWPLRKPTGCVIVSDVATGREQLRVPLHSGPWQLPMMVGPTRMDAISDYGRTIVIFDMDGSDGPVITCWDVPGRPSPWPVIGIPLGLGCIAVVLRWWWMRKAKGTA